MALVGIARLAARSELLDAKSQVEYFEIPARSILNRTRPGLPFHWTVNPYRGCEFACRYCYARYTHEFMELGAREFDDRIYAKTAAAHLLRQELRRVRPGERIAIGTATDPYQPAERRYRCTQSILEVFARQRGFHVSVTTKSDLVTRDLDLLREASRGNVLSVNLTITTLDARLARLLEPRAPRPDLRLAAVEKLAAAGLHVGVFPNPVMPWLTDSEPHLDRLARAARDAGARYFGGGPVFLQPCAQQVFFPFLEEHFPSLLPRYRQLFARGAFLGPAYRRELQQRLHTIRARYNLASSLVEYLPELWDAPEQASLFPLH
jgi:DNA repair photolyase